MSRAEDLRNAYRSGQMSEAQWQAHVAAGDVEAEPAPARAASLAALDTTALCLAAIPPRAKDKSDWGTGGEVKCPACETGMIQWRRSIRNGHLAARCTAGCFAMMQ